MHSRPPKEALLGSPLFYLVCPDDLDGLDEWTEYLDSIIHGPCRVEESEGVLCLIEERQLVDRVRGLRIEIYGDEHPPPHFHVKSADVDASFAIDDCRCIKGIETVSRRALRAIQFWYSKARPVLIEVWNSTRPDGCSVGEFRQPA